MSEKINIKPCPFCGGEILRFLPTNTDEEGSLHRARIKCPACDLTMVGPSMLLYGWPTDQELKALDDRLIKKWNRREAENE